MFTYAETKSGGLFKDLTPGGRAPFDSGTYEAVKPGYYSVYWWEMTADHMGSDTLYEFTVLQ